MLGEELVEEQCIGPFVGHLLRAGSAIGIDDKRHAGRVFGACGEQQRGIERRAVVRFDLERFRRAQAVGIERVRRPVGLAGVAVAAELKQLGGFMRDGVFVAEGETVGREVRPGDCRGRCSAVCARR